MEINATGGHSSENDSHSYEEEFVLWMLTQWMDSLPFTEQIPVNHILRSLESSEFYEHLTSDDPEVGFILDAEKNKAKKTIDGINKLTKDFNNIDIKIFISPNNEDNGMLEDLFLEVVKKQKIYNCVNEFTQCIKTHQKINNESKQQMLAYLSTLDKNDILSIRNAVINGYFKLYILY